MNLQELAQGMAAGLNLKVEHLDQEKAILSGRAVQATVRSFFGGWQVDLELPGFRPAQFFEEDLRMLVQRVGNRIAAYEEHLREQAGGGEASGH